MTLRFGTRCSGDDKQTLSAPISRGVGAEHADSDQPRGAGVGRYRHGQVECRSGPRSRRRNLRDPDLHRPGHHPPRGIITHLLFGHRSSVAPRVRPVIRQPGLTMLRRRPPGISPAVRTNAFRPALTSAPPALPRVAAGKLRSEELGQRQAAAPVALCQRRVLPSICSRMMSAWPAWRAVS